MIIVGLFGFVGPSNPISWIQCGEKSIPTHTALLTLTLTSLSLLLLLRVCRGAGIWFFVVTGYHSVHGSPNRRPRRLSPFQFCLCSSPFGPTGVCPIQEKENVCVTGSGVDKVVLK